MTKHVRQVNAYGSKKCDLRPGFRQPICSAFGGKVKMNAKLTQMGTDRRKLDINGRMIKWTQSRLKFDHKELIQQIYIIGIFCTVFMLMV